MKTKLNEKWQDNNIQFPRLLAEIRANCEFSNDGWLALCDSMNLSIADIVKIFVQAQLAFEKIKEKL